MPLGYSYVERDADSQINWAEVGAQTSGMLLEVNRVREEKKDALAQAQRESLDNLMKSPQGVDQSINSKINDFAHNLIAQKKIDYDLLTRGQMSVRDYTLKVQNQLDGTNNLFEVSKQLQANRQATLDGIADGTLQSAGNIFNGGFVEKMSDLSNLSINVNSPTGEINLGMYEDKVIDGKTVKVLGSNVTTPNMLLGMVAQKIPTFYTDKQTTNWVENMGEKKAAVYAAATTAGAGTISEYLGPTYLASIKDPQAKQIASHFNQSIDDLVNSKIGGSANSYNLMGVITTDLGKYGADNFTYNENEAKSDKNKILVMINQSTHNMDLDPKGANYERMKKEATDYVRNQIILKLDEEKKITTTGQLSESAYTKERAARINRGPSGEAPPPVILAQPQFTKGFDEKTKTKVDGVASGLENLIINEANGIQQHANAIGYNNVTGALEIKGYQASGKKEEGKTGPEIEGVVGKSGESGVRQIPFTSSDKVSSRLLSLFVPKIRNPEDPKGGNFRSVAQAKDYFKRVYQSQAGTTAPTANTVPAKKTIQFDSQGNIIQ